MPKQRAGRKKRTHAGVKILQLRDGRHVARWVDPLTKKQQQKSLDKLNLTSDETRRSWAKEKAEALAGLRRAVALGAVQSTRVPVAAAVKTYLDGIAHDATRASKKLPLDTFAERVEAAGVASMADVAGPAVMAWRDWVTSPKQERQASTQNLWLAIAGSFMRWARKRGMAPLLTLETIKDGCERVPEPFEDIEFLRPAALRKVLGATIAHDREHPDRRCAAFVLALVLSGCRLAEIGQLPWREVEDDGIHLPANRVKTRRARVVTFAETPTLRELFAALRPKDAKAGDLVFPLAYVQWENVLIALKKHHGAPEFTAHTLRRTAGTVLTNAPGIHGGASAWHSAKRLGHGVAQAERDYAGRLTGLSSTAKTFEAAVGIEKIARAIVAAK